MRTLCIAILGAAFSLGAYASWVDQPLVNISALKEVETSTDARFRGDPWEMLGDTRGTYLPGYGAVFTFEMSLVQMTPISPFHMSVTPQEIKSVHDRKVKQLAVLKDTMRDLIAKASASLTGLPASEQVVFEARLLYQPYEDHTGLPWRLAMIGNRQKMLDAIARHATPADIAALIEERKE